MGLEFVQSDDVYDNISELVRRIKEKNQNIGNVAVMISWRIARLMIHFRYDEDPITEIPEEFIDEDGTVSPGAEEFYSSHNRMMPYSIVIENGTIDIDEHVEEITRRLTRNVCITTENVQ